ncbi:hypothetical protein B0H19DRAFT_1078906 [Mycena capillaripes]|nr:hypothetical protein B0H19DRAFT_1078906 [Mycena capillaripes]
MKSRTKALWRILLASPSSVSSPAQAQELCWHHSIGMRSTSTAPARQRPQTAVLEIFVWACSQREAQEGNKPMFRQNGRAHLLYSIISPEFSMVCAPTRTLHLITHAIPAPSIDPSSILGISTLRISPAVSQKAGALLFLLPTYASALLNSRLTESYHRATTVAHTLYRPVVITMYVQW